MRWEPLERALEVLSYDNARGVLRRGAEMARTLLAVGEGRARPRPSRFRRPSPRHDLTWRPSRRCSSGARPSLALRRALPRGDWPLVHGALAGPPRHAAAPPLPRCHHHRPGRRARPGARRAAPRFPGDAAPSLSPGALRRRRTAAPRASRARRRRSRSKGSTSRCCRACCARHGLTARRLADLLPLADALDLTDELQRDAWETDRRRTRRAASTPRRSRGSSACAARRCRDDSPPAARRRSSARSTRCDWSPPRSCSAIPAYRVADAARLLGFSSVSLLQQTARRTFGVSAREVATLDAGRMAATAGAVANGRALGARRIRVRVASRGARSPRWLTAHPYVPLSFSALVRTRRL